MRISFFLFLALILAACTAGYGFQATITVGSTGNATTIQQAFQMMGSTVMADSVTLYLGDAVYNEGELSLTQHNGYPKSVKIMGNPVGEPPTINFSQALSNGTAISVTSIEAFTMTGVNVNLSQSAAWSAAVSVHLTAGQLKTPSASSGISIYAPSATKGLDIDVEGGGSYAVSASTITTSGPSIAPGAGISKLILDGNTFNTDSKVIDGTNLRSDTVVIGNNNITKSSNATSPVLEVPLTQGENARYVWVHDNQLHLSGAATTAIDLSTNTGGSVLVTNNLVTLGGYTSCDSRGIHISGFGGIGSTISITDDSISGGGVAIWLEGIKAGTAVILDNLGLEAAISGIMVGSNSYPASVTIGGGGTLSQPTAGRWSPFGISGASRARVRNNAHGNAPLTKPVNPSNSFTSAVSCPTGAAIDLTLASSSCAVAIHYTQIAWASTIAISCSGKFAGSITTDNNLIDLNGSSTGISIAGFGGPGATIVCDGDSITNADVGIALDSIKAGTAVSLTNFGIRAITNGIAVPAGNHPTSLTIGTTSGTLAANARTPFGTLGRSRAQIMRNSRSMAPIAGKGNLPLGVESLGDAGIAIGMTGGSCAVTIQGTFVYWVGNGISINGAIGGSVATTDNLIDLNGTGNGLYFNKFGGSGATLVCTGDSINNAGTGIMLDSVASGTAASIQNFGIRAANTGIFVPAGNHPVSLTIGLSGGAIAGKGNSPMGISGSSRARVMNNARSMVPVAGRGNLPFGTESGSGPGIDIGINGGSCVLTIQGTEVYWTGAGISIDGHFAGELHTSDNRIDLTGSGTGLSVAGFGGAGSTIDMQGDSLNNTGTGVALDSTTSGTHVAIQNFGISASNSAIWIPAGNMQSMLTIGGSGSGSMTSARSPLGTMGRSRGTARNNAAAAFPVTKHGDSTLGVTDSPSAAIDVTISNPACVVAIASTDVRWVSTTGISVKGHSNAALTTSDNVVTLNGGGTGISVSGFGGTGSSFSSSDDSLANTGYGIKLDSVVIGTAVSLTNFGISADQAAISVPAGNKPSLLIIGGSESGLVSGFRSPFGTFGRSRGTARNNAAVMKPSTGIRIDGFTDVATSAIEISADGSACNTSVSATDITWPGNGISVKGGSQHHFSTSDNMINASSTGILLSGFGGMGSSVSCDGDSISGGTTGVSVDSVAPGTGLAVTNFRIRASMCGVSAWGSGGMSGITLGGNAPASVPKSGHRFPNPSSRARIMNNAREAAPKAGERSPMSVPFAAIAIKPGSFTGAVSVTGTDILWDGPVGIRIGKGNGPAVSLAGNTISGNNTAGGAAVVLDSVTADSVLISGNTMDQYPLMQLGTVLANVLYEVGGNSFVSGGDSINVFNGRVYVHDNQWKCQDACLKDGSSTYLCGKTDHLAVAPATVRRDVPAGTVAAGSRTIVFARNIFNDFTGHGLDLTIDRTSTDSVKLVLDGNTFARTGKSCLFLHGVGNSGSGSTYMAGNSFKQGGEGGCTITINGGDFHVYDDASFGASAATIAGASAPNNFTDNQGNGLVLHGDIAFPNGFHLQNFSGNSGYNVVNGTPNSVDMTGNWWGTTDSAAIAQSILDGSDSSGLGGSSFYPYQTEAIPTATEVTASISLTQGWNMISLPVIPANLSKSTLFPAAVSNAFSFNGAYQNAPALQAGKGYWLKMPSAGTQSVTGLERTSDTIDVAPGWNLVGALSSAIAASSIASIPGGIKTSQFYGYAAGYFNADSIKAGKGYWIKVVSVGKLVLGTAAAHMPASNRIQIIPGAELPPKAPGAVDGIANGNGGEEASSAIRELPKEFALRQNYPNPFNPSTVIQFDLPAASIVTLKVYNVLGQEVTAVLDAQAMQAGFQTITFDASHMATGTYVYRIQAVRADGTPADVFTSVRKMLLIR